MRDGRQQRLLGQKKTKRIKQKVAKEAKGQRITGFLFGLGVSEAGRPLELLTPRSQEVGSSSVLEFSPS